MAGVVGHKSQEEVVHSPYGVPPEVCLSVLHILAREQAAERGYAVEKVVEMFAARAGVDPLDILNAPRQPYLQASDMFQVG